MDRTLLVMLAGFTLGCLFSPVVTGLLLRRKLKRLVSRPFRPVYSKTDSILFADELKQYTVLANLLEPAGMRLVPNAAVQQIARVKEGMPLAESSQAFSDLDGRSVQFLLVATRTLAPLAVVYIGGDGANQVPDLLAGVLRSSADFCRKLFESIGVPEIVVYDRDMENPERVVSRIQEILKGGEVGVINV